MTNSTRNEAQRPRRVLRVGFAGNTTLPAGSQRLLRPRLEAVYTQIAELLETPWRDDEPAKGESVPRPDPIAEYYNDEAPLLRLVTGLAEGADDLAVEALDGFDSSAIATELAAVLPAPLADYRATRPEPYRARFDELAQRCSYVQTLDGKHRKLNAEERDQFSAAERFQIDQRRSLSYRAQSEMLLRHSDLIVAVADTLQASKAGGTLETVRKALEFRLPVVLLDTGDAGRTWFLRQPHELDRLTTELAHEPTWREELRARLRTLLLGAPVPPRDELEGLELLKEFFEANEPLHARGWWVARPRFAWTGRLKRLRAGTAAPEDKATLAPYLQYRNRAKSLNYHYSDAYRITFYNNFYLSVYAVALAAVSLALLALWPKEQGGLYAVLFVLAVIKLAFVSYISVSTGRANHKGWNDRAVDYRYLAERLRTMLYLPRLGSFQPPAAAPAQFASRAVRQKAVDWLFDAIVRSVPPNAVSDGDGRALVTPATETAPATLNADAYAVTRLLRDDWVREQAVYHHRTQQSMQGLQKALSGRAQVWSLVVIVVVLLDIALLLVKSLGGLPGLADQMVVIGALLVLAVAVIPAYVASQNGIRFQSECSRLAERSSFLRFVLWGTATCRSQAAGNKAGYYGVLDELADRIGRARALPDDPGSWSITVLHSAEEIARELVEEVAEWSVLYAKEMAEA